MEHQQTVEETKQKYSYAKKKSNSLRSVLSFQRALGWSLLWTVFHQVHGRAEPNQERNPILRQLRAEVSGEARPRGLIMASTQTTSIVNLRHHNTAEVNCGRGSPFGNPFSHELLGITRDEACERFKEYFYNKLRRPEFRDKVLALKGKRLGCWCKCQPHCGNPKCISRRCHLETIVEYLENETR